MAGEPTLFEALGLPEVSEAMAARRRMRERAADLISEGEIPWPSRLSEARSQDDELGQCTGLPTQADIWGRTECLEEWAEDYLDQKSEEEPDEPWEFPWWLAAVIGAGWGVWELLDHPVGFDSGDIEWEIDGFEIDGIPWTVDKMHHPDAPLAARVGEMMLHGGKALPGPGSPDVFIGGERALTVSDAVAACPMANVVGIPHIPQPGSWQTTNGSVYVNGKPLLRHGDWFMEYPGGPNPIIGGMPSVLAGPEPRSVMVQEVQYKGLDFFVDDLERVGWTGGKITLKASVSWTYQDAVKGLAAIGLFHLGYGSPLLAPVTTWGAKRILDSMAKPKITHKSTVDMGTLFGETRKDFENPAPWGPRNKTTREKYQFELPDFGDDRSAEVDPAQPWPPIKKDEKGGWKWEPVDKGPEKLDEDVVDWGPFKWERQTHDANEAPKPWDDEE